MDKFIAVYASPGTMNRSDSILALANRIAAMRLGHPVRAAVDGVDAAGKTTLADELVEP